jgi:hypothetical protein
LDLERNSEILKSVRRGDWSLEEGKAWFSEKEKSLETLYAKCTLPATPDVNAIKRLLLECLETHYGSLDKAIVEPASRDTLVREMQELLNRYR